MCDECWQEERDTLYKERNLCVALLADMARGLDIPVWIANHQGQEAWDDEWRNVLFVDLPGVGQVSWHLHNSELEHFKHIPKNYLSSGYDGHSTEEKYNRIKEYVKIY